MFYKKQRESITFSVYKVLRKKEHDRLKTMTTNAKRKANDTADFKHRHAHSGEYILDHIIRAAQAFYDHHGQMSWREDERMEIGIRECVKMLDNFVQSGSIISPLLAYFHSKVSNKGVKSPYTYEEVTRKHGTVVNGYLDYQSRPSQLNEIGNFVL
jgi:hypothetical protein